MKDVHIFKQSKKEKYNNLSCQYTQLNTEKKL